MGPPSKPIPGLCWHVASHAVFVHSFRLTMWEDRSTAAGQCNFLFFSRQSSRLKTLLSFEDCCKAGQRWWHVFSNVWTMLFHVLFMALLLEIRKDCHKVFLTSFVGWLLLEEFSPALLLLLLILQRSVCLRCQTTAEIWRSRLCYLLYCVIPRCLKSTDRLQQRAVLLPAFWCIAEAKAELSRKLK